MTSTMMIGPLMMIKPMILDLFGIMDKIQELISNFLRDAVKSAVSGIDASYSQQLSNMGEKLAQPPDQFSQGAFEVIKSIQKNAVVPIGILILTYIFCYELIQLAASRNKGVEIGPPDFFMIIVKTGIGIVLVNHVFEIVVGFFQISAWMINKVSASGATIDSVESSVNRNADAMAAQHQIGALIVLWLVCFILRIVAGIVGVVALYLVYARMLEIYVMASVAPLTMGALFNREFTHMGQNYLKNMFALALQGFFMIVCLAIFNAFTGNLLSSANGAWEILFGFILSAAILFSMMFKSGTLAKSVVGAH